MVYWGGVLDGVVTCREREIDVNLLKENYKSVSTVENQTRTKHYRRTSMKFLLVLSGIGLGSARTFFEENFDDSEVNMTLALAHLTPSL
jgi:hypothetical protein